MFLFEHVAPPVIVPQYYHDTILCDSECDLYGSIEIINTSVHELLIANDLMIVMKESAR